MSQQSNNPYGSNPGNPGYPSQPNYPPAPDTAYGGEQFPGGSPSYGQYAPPPPPGASNPNYNSPYAPPPPDSPVPTAYGPYDQTVISSNSGANYLSYSPPGGPNYNTPPSIPPLPPTTPTPKSSSRTILIAVIALIVIVGGILGIVLYSNHNTAVTNANNTATAQILAQTQATGTAQSIASATANAQATATYVRSHYPFSTNLVLNDPLTDSSNATKYGWDQASACSFTNGAYQVTESQVNFIQPCTATNTNFANFTYEIQMTIKSGGTGAEGGVMFRADMNKDQLYIFHLGTDGSYTLEVRANSSGASSRTLKSGTISGFATGFNQVHTIGVVANGPQISVYVDQSQVTQTSDPTYSSGTIGVISDYGSSTTVVAYNNAKVWQL